MKYPSPWKFDASVADIFDSHVRQSIPLFDASHRVTNDFAEPFLKKNSLVLDVGVGTGDGILTAWQRFSDLKLNFIGIDSSLPMLEKARVNLASVPNLELVHSPVEDYCFPASSLIKMNYTLHFTDPKDRLDILKKCRVSTRKGGCLALLEKIEPRSKKSKEVFRKVLHNYKRSQGLSREEVAMKDKSLQNVLRPLSLDDNISLLRAAGFKVVEPYFSCGLFVGILAF